MKVRIFNGFVENAFPAKHQDVASMRLWEDQLASAAPGIVRFPVSAIERCWAYSMVRDIDGASLTRGHPQAVCSADYPNSPTDRYASHEDALRSQIVLCQRFEWLKHAALSCPDVDIWAWVEPTIFKQRNITAAVIQWFLRDIEEHPVDAISLPGVLPKIPVVDHINHWRFCGSAWVCPAKYAQVVSDTMKELITMRTRLTHRLCWDNSSWAYLELLNVLPIRWYPGNHDETQFTGYKIGIDQWDQKQ